MGGCSEEIAHHSPKFKPTLICGDCNASDAAVKRKFGLPEHWSFAPHEIKQFVRVTAHSGKTIIDHDKAWEIWKFGSEP